MDVSGRSSSFSSFTGMLFIAEAVSLGVRVTRLPHSGRFGGLDPRLQFHLPGGRDLGGSGAATCRGHGVCKGLAPEFARIDHLGLCPEGSSYFLLAGEEEARASAACPRAEAFGVCPAVGGCGAAGSEACCALGDAPRPQLPGGSAPSSRGGLPCGWRSAGQALGMASPLCCSPCPS